jgi:hypothetical protein
MGDLCWTVPVSSSPRLNVISIGGIANPMSINTTKDRLYLVFPEQPFSVEGKCWRIFACSESIWTLIFLLTEKMLTWHGERSCEDGALSMSLPL